MAKKSMTNVKRFTSESLFYKLWQYSSIHKVLIAEHWPNNWVLLQQTAYLVGPSTTRRGMTRRGMCPPSYFGCPGWGGRCVTLVDGSPVRQNQLREGQLWEGALLPQLLAQPNAGALVRQSCSRLWQTLGAAPGKREQRKAAQPSLAQLIPSGGCCLHCRSAPVPLPDNSKSLHRFAVLGTENCLVKWRCRLPLLALSSDNKTLCRSCCGMTAVNTHWVTPHQFK